MIALRHTAIEKQIPWVCTEMHPDATEELCTPETKAHLGCARGALADDTVRFLFGGRIAKKNLITEIDFDRCPLASLRDAPPDVEAWTDFAIRISMAAENGSVNILDYSSGELALIHAADDIRAKVKIEQVAEQGDGGGA